MKTFLKKLLKVAALFVLMLLFFLLLCVQSAAGAAEPVDKPVAEQVIRALVEGHRRGNEWDPNVLGNASNALDANVHDLANYDRYAGIAHLAGIDPEQVVTLDKPRWTKEEAQMLVTLAMAEAEGEDTVGKALVILVVLNRVESDSFPDSIEEVIFQENQFSPAKPGHRYYTVAPNADCWAALEMVESGWDESQGALYFERKTEKETWHSKNLIELYSRGKHTFYKEG